MVYIFVLSLVLIMVGELADKSQLLALLLATRYRAWQVLTGIFLATFVVHFFTALAGQLAGGLIPVSAMPWISGSLFIGFGIWTLRGDRVEEGEADRGSARFGPVMATAVAFFFAELGDKTQFMTLAIAADPGAALLGYLGSSGPAVQQLLGGAASSVALASPVARFWAVTLGSTVGMVLADAVAIGVGRLLGRNLPELWLRRVSGIAFIVFGAVTLASSLLAR